MTPRRLLPAALLGLALVPAPAAAQFNAGFGFNPAGFLPINPYSNPYFSSYRYGSRGISAYSSTPYGSMSVDASRSYVGTRSGYNRFFRGPYPYAPGNGYGYGTGASTFGGYFGGGIGGTTGSPYPQSGATQASIAAAQVQGSAASPGRRGRPATALRPAQLRAARGGPRDRPGPTGRPGRGGKSPPPRVRSRRDIGRRPQPASGGRRRPRQAGCEGGVRVPPARPARPAPTSAAPRRPTPSTSSGAASSRSRRPSAVPRSCRSATSSTPSSPRWRPPPRPARRCPPPPSPD